jgi:hypothetical protein
MPKKEYQSLPDYYPVCLHAGCPLATTCLHQLAYQELVRTAEYLRLINPLRCTKDDTCPYFRNNKPVVYARGFTNFQTKMFPEQYNTFMTLLIRQFGRNSYFERRRGAYGLPPREQEIVLSALRQAGVTEAVKFDGYEEKINWYD